MVVPAASLSPVAFEKHVECRSCSYDCRSMRLSLAVDVFSTWLGCDDDDDVDDMVLDTVVGLVGTIVSTHSK